ncbi:hypothetical protein CEUSTIGMA_g10582.t1 [Chlamydomonas eustigma]|uniref:CCDC66 domain-containing protein n=1 Tax=Chlamydomonas eustigma TaxID=1157962 RepID=A0A250XJG1_9CHLO|nr:hypothetical protein CEUSTIGMA_g10582.t1 [Chlamydomonas eustigma]|eukprot:GAX83156.1 hypothetical protein CEUSTIGMA_g10582.t1 [Chlamydomonas eustigma]
MNKIKREEKRRPGNKNPKTGGQTDELLQSKQNLLAALTRQADENTRILERERAAVFGGERKEVLNQGRQGGGIADPSQRIPRSGVQVGIHDQGAHRNKPPPPARLQIGQQKKGVAHVFLDGHNKKVYDPSEIPGLSPGPKNEPRRSSDVHIQERPWSSFKPTALQVQPESDALEGTFPDSPSFYPGMIFSVPVAGQHAPPPASQLPYGQANDTRSVGNSAWVENHLQAHSEAHAGVGGRPSSVGEGGESKAGHGWFQGEEKEVGGRRNRLQRDEATKRQEAYRRELDEQVQAQRTRKENERVAARHSEHQVRLDGQRSAAGIGGRGGGGGEPLRLPGGGLMADLRQSPHAHVPMPLEHPFMHQPLRATGPSTHMTMEVPGNYPMVLQQYTSSEAIDANPYPPPGARAAPPSVFGQAQPVWQGSHRIHPTLQPAPHLLIPDSNQPPESWQPHHAQVSDLGRLSPPQLPTAAPPAAVSPTGAVGGQRRYMADLRPGPSEEQLRQKEQQRFKLAADLEEQIRQKKERDAQAKAQEKAAMAKEEAELRMYYQRMQEQRDAEERAKRAAKGGGVSGVGYPPSEGGAPLPSQAWSQPPTTMMAGPVAPPPVRRQRSKNVLDADWLDKIPSAAAPVVPDLGFLNVGASHVSNADVVGARRAPRTSDGWQDSAPGLPTQDVEDSRIKIPVKAVSPLAQLAGSSNKLDIASMLQELQQEQVKLKEEFARQSEAMRNVLQSVGVSHPVDSDRAWQELDRIRKRLTDTDSRMEALRFNETTDALDQFIVSTHLVPRDVNAIPSRLTTPMEAAWVRDAIEQRGYSPSASPGMPGVGIAGPALPDSHAAAAHYGVHGMPLHGISDEGEEDYYNNDGERREGQLRLDELEFLDCLDQLLGQQEQQKGQDWSKGKVPKEERGLYAPISHLSGPPSLIPRAPLPPTSLLHQHVPKSRVGGSFFNLEGDHNNVVPQQPVGRRALPSTVKQGAQGRSEAPILLAGGLPSAGTCKKTVQAAPRFSSAKIASRAGPQNATNRASRKSDAGTQPSRPGAKSAGPRLSRPEY